MKCFWGNEIGQGVVEYALIITFVVLVVIVGVRILGGTTNGIYQDINDNWPS